MVRQIAHIIIPPREKRSATFRVFTAETTPEEEAERGLLFGCFVIDYYHHRNEEILDSITEELQGRYYDPDIATRQPEDLFEETLRTLNTTLAQLIENEQIFLNLKRFHGVIGVLRGRSITFTHVGDFRVYLMHQSIAEKQHFIDLLATTETADDKKSPALTRIFATLVSGTLRTNDAVFFSTNNLFDYTTKEHVQKIVGSSPPPRALEQIKSLIKTEKGTAGILCFLLRLAPEHEIKNPEQSNTSLTTLHATEEDARQYLAPSLFRNTLRHGVRITHTVEMVLKKFLRIPDDAPRHAIAKKSLTYILALLRIIGRMVVLAQRFCVVCIKIARDIFRDRSNLRDALMTIRAHGREGFTPLLHKGKAQFAGMTLRQRVLIIAASSLAIILLISTITIAIQRSRTLKRETYEKNIALIRERIDTAEASLLFKDEERTKTIYNEAMKLIEILPKKSNDERATREALTKEVLQHLERLRHVVPIARVDVVKDFRDLDPAVELQALAVSDTTAYVAHGARPLLYKVNLENQQTLTLDASQVDVRPVRHIAQEEKGRALYLAFDTAGIATLNLERQSVAQTDITFGAPGTTVTDITLYNKRLYILDAVNKQIWRHEQKDNSFAKGVTWLKTPVDLSGATAFAIDGAVWIVKSNEVLRLLQGKPSSWQLETIDPAIGTLRRVVARPENNKLWLLDEGEKRVLAIAKDSGKLLAQYPLPAEDIRDFSVNEKTGKILLLTKTKLLSLTYEKE